MHNQRGFLINGVDDLAAGFRYGDDVSLSQLL